MATRAGSFFIHADRVGMNPNANAFNFNAHTWAGEGASACDICRNELVPRFDAVSFNSGSIVNLFSLACDGTNKRCDPKPKTVIDMALNPNGK